MIGLASPLLAAGRGPGRVVAGVIVLDVLVAGAVLTVLPRADVPGFVLLVVGAAVVLPALVAVLVLSLTAATGPLAVSWPTSQRVTDPAAEAADGLGGLVNVRLFAVSDDADELVMDTRGLAPFELPDLQVHFRDLEPGRLAGLLYATASYLLEEGDVIADGNTISGLQGDEHWRCVHEDALVPPARTVLDIDPGDPYAAGRRAR